VLEGVGLIEKRSKNIIQWKSVVFFVHLSFRVEHRGGQLRRAGQEPSADEAQRLFDVKLELADLERQERLIDKDLKWLKQVCLLFSLR
jgi:hypothetical protein